MGDARAPQDQASLLADFIRAERVRFVFLKSGPSIYLSPLVAAVMSSALWHAVDHRHLVFWTAGVAVLATIRFFLIRAYRKSSSQVQNVAGWERAFVASVLAIAAWWGAGGLLFLVDTLAERVLVFCFLILMAGGSAANYAAHPPTVTMTTLALAMPVTLHFALVGDVLHRSLAFAAVVYVAAMIRSIRTLGQFFAQTHRLAYELEAARDRAEDLARTDQLTDLYNRRAFHEFSDAAIRLARRYEHPVSLVIMDIDHFKAINDNLGHSAGDAAIRDLAQLIRERFRDTDIPCRFGGEEFCVLLPETPFEDALATAERFRIAVAQHTVRYEGKTIRFQVSLGVACLEGDESLEELVSRADKALYDAKRGGRNRVNSVPPISSARPVRASAGPNR